jgi:hypothetical protein
MYVLGPSFFCFWFYFDFYLPQAVERGSGSGPSEQSGLVHCRMERARKKKFEVTGNSSAASFLLSISTNRVASGWRQHKKDQKTQ